jgi:hypothetical protein
MNIGIFYEPCGMPISFDDMRIAAEFVKLLAGVITADAWVAFIHAVDPVNVDKAKELATMCMGAPA